MGLRRRVAVHRRGGRGCQASESWDRSPLLGGEEGGEKLTIGNSSSMIGFVFYHHTCHVNDVTCNFWYTFSLL